MNDIEEIKGRILQMTKILELHQTMINTLGKSILGLTEAMRILSVDLDIDIKGKIKDEE